MHFWTFIISYFQFTFIFSSTQVCEKRTHFAKARVKLNTRRNLELFRRQWSAESHHGRKSCWLLTLAVKVEFCCTTSSNCCQISSLATVHEGAVAILSCHHAALILTLYRKMFPIPAVLANRIRVRPRCVKRLGCGMDDSVVRIGQATTANPRGAREHLQAVVQHGLR